ncbi:MAG: hypothetical protein U0T33_11575 [Bacteroidales bacterium]
MDFNSTIDIIIKDLREIREIVDDLKNTPGVSVLQIELAKSKCRSAEEIIALLKVYKPAGNTEKNIPEQPVQNPLQSADKFTVIPEEEAIAEPVAETNVKNEISEQVKESETNPGIIKDFSRESSILSQNFSDSGNSLVEQFGSKKRGEDLAATLKSQVSSLSEIIGFNDKFLFISQVFGGNTSKYEEALQKLNRAESLNDARAIIMSYSGELEGNAAATQLLELVKRKLPSNG